MAGIGNGAYLGQLLRGGPLKLGRGDWSTKFADFRRFILIGLSDESLTAGARGDRTPAESRLTKNHC